MKDYEDRRVLISAGIYLAIIIILGAGLFFTLPLMPLLIKLISIILFGVFCLILGTKGLIHLIRSKSILRYKSIFIMIAALGLIGGSVAFFTFLYNVPRLIQFVEDAHVYSALILDLEDIVDEYIKRNNGKFPLSKQDLQSHDFLKKERTNKGVHYLLNKSPEFPEAANVLFLAAIF